MHRNILKKLAIITFCLLFTGALVFASGSSQQQTASGKPTLEIGIQTNAFILDFVDNYLTHYLENLHNIDLTFYYLPTDATESRTKVSLLAASNDLPETIWGGGMTREQILEYGTNNLLLALNKYLSNPSVTPYFNAIPQPDRGNILRDTRSADGNNYSFARFQPETWNCTPNRLYINRTWLSNLGLQEPKSTDDLRNVLTAFRDKDPNGNGRKDEIGVFGWYNGTYGENVITSLINAFVYYNPGQLALDASGNNVVASFTDPQFRAALQYLNGLFKDGLLDASTFTTDQQGFRAVLNGTPMVVGLTSMGSVGNFAGNPTQDDNANYRAMAPIMAPLSSPNCPGYTPFNDYVAEQMTFITNKCKNVDLAVKVMDSFYEPTLSIITRFGQENVDWTRDPAILKTQTNAMVYMGLYPGLSSAQIHDIWTKPAAQHWQNLTPRYTPLDVGNTIGNLESPLDPSKPSTMHNAVNYQLLIPRHPQYVLPQLYYSAADGATLSQPITDINQYVSQSVAEFIISTRDINSDAAWNAYLQNLDGMGLQKWIPIAQATYNRQK
ncbi:MAG: extracellular solute-binding protein [Treponema sp.]|nr:extracellular solute-binding protein [Treponema sp.]